MFSLVFLVQNITLIIADVQKKQDEIAAQMMTKYTHREKINARDSPIWNTFHLLFDKDENEVLGFYFCTKCEKVVYSPFAVAGSTTQLLRHGCVPNQHKGFTIDNAEFETLKRAAAKFVSLDLRPFQAVECPGLLELTMADVNLGKRYQNMTIDDLYHVFPTRNTIKDMVKADAENAKDSIKILFRKAMNNGGFGCTLDLWSDSYKYNSYLAMTADMFLVEGNEIVQKRIVFHMGKIAEIVKSKEVIRRRIIDVFREFGLTEEDIKLYVTFTTDR